MLLTAPPIAGAQQAGKVYRIGVLSVQSSFTVRPVKNAFKQKLRDLGYVEGRNLVIENRFAEGRYERLPELARELLRLNVDLLVATDGASSTLSLKAATKTIPIVFYAGAPSSPDSWRASHD